MIGNLRYLKEATTLDMILAKCKLQNIYFFLIFSINYVVGTHWNCLYVGQFQCVPTTYVFSVNQFFTYFQHISFFQ